MQQFPKDPMSMGNSPVWGGQQGTPSVPPAWGGQPGTPPGTPPSAGQPGAPSWVDQGSNALPSAGQPGAPSWANQGSNALPFGIQPTLLDRSVPWSALRLISRALKIVAWVVLVIGTIASLVVGVQLGSLGNSLGVLNPSLGAQFGFFAFTTTVVYLVGTAIGFLALYGSAEVILVLLAIEKNTRKSE